MNTGSNCLLCGKICLNCSSLSNGTLYHRDCYKNLCTSISVNKQYISKNNQKIHGLQSTLRESKNIGYKIKTFFGGDKLNIKSLESQILKAKNELKKLETSIKNTNLQLQQLYDYWLEIPPDWDLRKETIKQKSFNQCNRCGEEYTEKHVHHKVPISQGGSHCLDNLEYLCVNCHSEAHHGRDVSIENKNNLLRAKSAYAQKLEIIQHAIDNNDIIQFSYKKYHGDKSRRAISPEYLEQKGKSLCVAGYCYLRAEDRIFAIKRMSRVKIVDEPGDCYDR